MGAKGRDRQTGRRRDGGREGGIQGGRESGSRGEADREAQVRERAGGQEVTEGMERSMDGSAERANYLVS